MDNNKNKSERPGSLRKALVVFALILIIAILLILLLKCGNNSGIPGASTQRMSHDAGRFVGKSAFYDSKDGIWVISSGPVYVLKDKKYVSGPTELEQYTVLVLNAGDRVRVTAAAGRWKTVQVLDHDNSVSVHGYIDSENVNATKSPNL